MNDPISSSFLLKIEIQWNAALGRQYHRAVRAYLQSVFQADPPFSARLRDTQALAYIFTEYSTIIQESSTAAR
jgi:hypothetical protein